LAVALAGCLLFLAEERISGSRYITGAYLIAIIGPFEVVFIFSNLAANYDQVCLDSGSQEME
jgi:hypothetical protein